jgi:hypothetical protein
MGFSLVEQKRTGCGFKGYEEEGGPASENEIGFPQ